MAKYRAEMVSGPRSPKEAAERQQAEQTKAGLLDMAFDALDAVRKADAVDARPAGEREFGSLYRNFMLTVKRSDEREINGITIPAKLETVLFVDGTLRTKDPVVIAAVERHKNYGRDIWDAAQLKAKAERVAAEGFLARVDLLPPDIKEQLRAKLSEDFPMPVPEPAAPPSA